MTWIDIWKTIDPSGGMAEVYNETLEDKHPNHMQWLPAKNRAIPTRSPAWLLLALVKRVLPSVVNIAVTETVSGGDVLANCRRSCATRRSAASSAAASAIAASR